MYWSGGGVSNISDRETEVISGLIKTVGALKNISYSSCFPAFTSSIICINSSALSSVAISSMKSANVSISFGSFNNKRPDGLLVKSEGYFIQSSPQFYFSEIANAATIVQTSFKYI